MKTKTFKELGYRKNPSVITMIKACDTKTHNMYQIHRDELSRIKTKYYRGHGTITPRQKQYLEMLYKNFVIDNKEMLKVTPKEIRKPEISNHIGMKMLNNL